MNCAPSRFDDRHAAGGDSQAVRDVVNSACRSSDIEMVTYFEAYRRSPTSINEVGRKRLASTPFIFTIACTGRLRPPLSCVGVE
jgi:hypothetical protein